MGSRHSSLGASAAAGTAAEALWSSPMTISPHRLNSGSLVWAYFVSNTLRTSLAALTEFPRYPTFFAISFARFRTDELTLLLDTLEIDPAPLSPSLTELEFISMLK